MKNNDIRNTTYDLPSDYNPKVAITADWIVGGGAERVVDELHKMYPNAPIYTSYCSDEWREKLDNKVVTGYLQHLGKIRKYLPILQYFWFRSLRLKNFDLIISSCGNGYSKVIKKPSNAIHINYCHTPVHYLWRHYEHYLKRPGFGAFNPIARLGLRLLVKPLQKLDYKATQNVDYFIANSTHIKNDIKKYYHKDATVIFPPVSTDRFKLKNQKRSGYITVGRLVPMKRVDIIVKACTELKVPLTVIGNGAEYSNLVKIAGLNVKFLNNASDNTVATELIKSEAFLFASFEDFGVTPVEAMAAGTPVIGYGSGGTQDYVNENTGILFKKQTVEDLIEAIKSSQKTKWDQAKISQHAQKFSKETFRQKINIFISQKLKD